ncbi:hypothetical protein ABBQ38_009937 [Trebouxia sp. C0009 RCD-2024]
MSVDLDGPKGGSCRASFAASDALVWPARAAEVLALVGLVADIVPRTDFIEPRLSNLPLLGRERLEALPGGRNCQS